MIESIHNNESNQDGKKVTYDAIKLPKNIRQVGQIEGNKHIYIEDYVMTYIKQMAMKSYGTYQVAVLLGEIRKMEQADYIFISGAVEVEDVIFDDDKVFDNEAWTKIYEDIKHYFSELEIVGWYITRPGLDLELNDRIKKIHLDNFAGNNKVLLMYDSVEREEVFYLYTKKNLVKQEGYYIYYERNDAMQSYMIEHKDKPSIEADFVDKASINIRSVIERKKSEKEVKKKGNSITYAAAGVAAIIILFGAGMVLTGRTSNSDANGDGNVAVAGNNATIEPTKEVTTVNVKPGDISTIKGEEVNGDKTTPSGSVAPSATPTKEAKATTSPAESTSPSTTPAATKKPDDVNVVIEGTDPITTVENKIPTYHTVVKGDTLGSISLKYYKTKKYMEKIMKLNGIEDSDKIYIGQKIKLP